MRPHSPSPSAALPVRAPRTFAFYYAAVVLAAVALFAHALPGLLPPPWLTLALVWGLMLASELAPIGLPGGGYATASAVFDLPSIVILGPVYTALLDVASTLLVQGAVLRKPAPAARSRISLRAMRSRRPGVKSAGCGCRATSCPCSPAAAPTSSSIRRWSPPSSASARARARGGSGSATSSRGCCTTCRSSRSARWWR